MKNFISLLFILLMSKSVFSQQDYVIITCFVPISLSYDTDTYDYVTGADMPREDTPDIYGEDSVTVNFVVASAKFEEWKRKVNSKGKNAVITFREKGFDRMGREAKSRGYISFLAEYGETDMYVASGQTTMIEGRISYDLPSTHIYFMEHGTSYMGYAKTAESIGTGSLSLTWSSVDKLESLVFKNRDLDKKDIVCSNPFYSVSDKHTDIKANSYESRI